MSLGLLLATVKAVVNVGLPLPLPTAAEEVHTKGVPGVLAVPVKVPTKSVHVISWNSWGGGLVVELRSATIPAVTLAAVVVVAVNVTVFVFIVSVNVFPETMVAGVIVLVCAISGALGVQLFTDTASSFSKDDRLK
jgi:hypothetical protein